MDRLNRNGHNLVVVDMRAPWEYQLGHIPGAKSMFIQEIPVRFHELPADAQVVFQCWHGNTSLDASAFLIQQGWSPDNVASLKGGMAGWVQTHGQESLVRA
jgi:rhodanese-related sulfurtransferase